MLTAKQAAPVLGGSISGTIIQGLKVTLGATDTAAHADDTLGNVTITGLPPNSSNFNGGTYTPTSNSWTGTAAQFNALTFGRQRRNLCAVDLRDDDWDKCRLPGTVKLRVECDRANGHDVHLYRTRR